MLTTQTFSIGETIGGIASGRREIYTIRCATVGCIRHINIFLQGVY